MAEIDSDQKRMEDRAAVVRHGRRLEYLTIGYNSIEGGASLISGFMAGSVALVAFGVDSLIEVASAITLLWRLHRDVGVAQRARAERISLRAVGVCFVALSVYVTWDAAKSLIFRHTPERSIFGIAIAAASLVVMPLLARSKKMVASRIDSGALNADAKQSDLCAYLSAILLGGLALNALFGWWWADPVASAAMVPIIGREGYEALRGERSCNDDHH